MYNTALRRLWMVTHALNLSRTCRRTSWAHRHAFDRGSSWLKHAYHVRRPSPSRPSPRTALATSGAHLAGEYARIPSTQVHPQDSTTSTTPSCRSSSTTPDPRIATAYRTYSSITPRPVKSIRASQLASPGLLPLAAKTAAHLSSARQPPPRSWPSLRPYAIRIGSWPRTSRRRRAIPCAPRPEIPAPERSPTPPDRGPVTAPRSACGRGWENAYSSGKNRDR